MEEQKSGQESGKQGQKPHKRRKRYSGTHPKKYEEKYKELNPDLVIMDITMPEMDGIEAVKEIKKINPSAAVIMCSAMGQQSMVIEAIQSGAKDFIVKPFQADRIIEAVRKVIG